MRASLCRFHDPRYAALTKLAESRHAGIDCALDRRPHEPRNARSLLPHSGRGERTTLEALKLPSRPVRVKDVPKVKRSAA